jgi:hypothetical protein
MISGEDYSVVHQPNKENNYKGALFCKMCETMVIMSGPYTINMAMQHGESKTHALCRRKVEAARLDVAVEQVEGEGEGGEQGV